jgi:GMP synthase (glutamine-hydrolysing)
LLNTGYRVKYVDCGVDQISAIDAIAPDLLVLLGGPIRAYQEDSYPVLVDELDLLTKRLEARRPTLGICLGAQLMARALDARVYPCGATEIGWAPITLSSAARESAFRHLGDGIAVLNWHGDTFDLPQDSILLASTPICRNQAFSWGPAAVGFQFHPEATAAGLERWFLGHACEIASSRLSINALRADTARYGSRLENQARKCFSEWLKLIG